MRPLWIVAAIACGVFAVAGVASASVREEARSLASTLATVAPLADGASPSPLPSPSTTESSTPSPLPGASPTEPPTSSPTPTETAAPPRNHGEAVSAVARDKEAMGTKTLPNGKTVTNHGMAVREAAHDKAGASMKSGAPGKSKGKNGD
jgi:hypothetical protein